ncbi:uncharacterized protein PG998_001085 [Apiospora kogelbergensis]|uniref:Uncharacterized protein n=1 Tax=Apiospora kogelbergensis TaxID=1337665 RepID=A0AAW0QSJ9_9PEZI
MERRVGEQQGSDGDGGPGPSRQGQRHSGDGPLPPKDVTDYVARPLPKIPVPRPSSGSSSRSSSNYESEDVISRDHSPAQSVPDYSSLVDECGGTLDLEGFAKIKPPKPARQLSVKTDHDQAVSPISPSTPTESWKQHVVSPGLPFTPGGSVDMPELIESYNYSPRRGKHNRAATSRYFDSNDGSVTVQHALRQPPHTYEVPSSLRVPRQPPDSKPSHRRSDPGSPLAREVSVVNNTGRDASHPDTPLRPGRTEVPVLRARSHDEQRTGSLALGLPPPSNLSSPPSHVSAFAPAQSRPPPPAAREKKISFAGPKANSYLNRTRASKQRPPPPPPRLQLGSSHRTADGHVKTPFPPSTFDSDGSGEDEGDKKARRFPSLSAFVSHSLNKPKTDGHHRGLGGLMSRVSNRFSSEEPKRDKRGGNAQQDIYLRAAEAVRQPPPGDEHNWI